MIFYNNFKKGLEFQGVIWELPFKDESLKKMEGKKKERITKKAV